MGWCIAVNPNGPAPREAAQGEAAPGEAAPRGGGTRGGAPCNPNGPATFWEKRGCRPNSPIQFILKEDTAK
jgi:hypothetical protein